MKRTVFAFSMVVLVSAPVSACGGAQGTNTTFLTWGTGTTGGAWYQITAAASSVVREHSQTVNVQPQATGGSVENMRLIREGAAQIGSSTPDTAYYAYVGGRGFEDAAPQLRAVGAGNTMFVYIMVRADSGIHKIQDLAGKTISVGAPGSATYVVNSAILKTLGIKNYQGARLGHSEAAKAVNDGTVDAMMALSGVPFSAASQLNATTDIRFIPMSQSELSQIRSRHPYWLAGELPAGTFKGQEKAVPGLEVETILVAGKTVPKDAVYGMLRVLYLKRHEDWVKADRRARGYSVKHTKELIEEGSVFRIPFHAGARKFFKEQGLKVPSGAKSGAGEP